MSISQHRCRIWKTVPSKIAKKASKRFPIAEPQKALAQEFRFTGPTFKAQSTEVMQWIYHGREREKRLTITPTTLVQTSKKYKTFEVFIDDIRDVLSEFFSVYQDLSASRVGLRFINIIKPGERNPLSWKPYINENMLGIIDFHTDKNSITRAFHILEYNFDGQAVKYQFGIVNPDYPSVIKKKEFVLDIDSYFHGAFGFTEIMENIEQSHAKIQDLFEKSITQKTRALMKAAKK